MPPVRQNPIHAGAEKIASRPAYRALDGALGVDGAQVHTYQSGSSSSTFFNVVTTGAYAQILAALSPCTTSRNTRRKCFSSKRSGRWATSGVCSCAKPRACRFRSTSASSRSSLNRHRIRWKRACRPRLSSLSSAMRTALCSESGSTLSEALSTLSVSSQHPQRSSQHGYLRQPRIALEHQPHEGDVQQGGVRRHEERAVGW